MGTKPPSKQEVENVLAVYLRSVSRQAAARELNMPPSKVYNWIFDIGPRLYGTPRPTNAPEGAKGRRHLEVSTGVVYVASDAHYWPGPASTAHKALCKFLKRDQKKLAAVILNGDAYDFPNISRWDVDWDKTPEVKDELEVVAERLGEIEKAAGKAKKYFPAGNHDQRFEKYIAKQAPELRGVSGTSLSERTPLWEPCWSLFINEDVVVKHRMRGGLHASTTNTLYAGLTTVTGHTHALEVRMHTDYRGTRFGVNCGCLADVYGPQFSYLEDSVRQWRAGFARIKWVDGRLLTPELVRVVEPDLVEFRGELIEV